MATEFVVTAPLVIARTQEGKDVYLYEGAPVPSEALGDKEVKRLKDAGLIDTPKAAAKAAAEESKPAAAGDGN